MTGVLLIFSGLPGVGKSTLAAQIARHLRATFLRIDTIEQGLRDLCGTEVEGEGYRLSYRIAADNLRVGNKVIADCCNTITLTRREWEAVATGVGASFLNIEITCSNKEQHRRRIETRHVDVPGLRLPTWQNVLDREYDEWGTDRVVIDTANTSIEDSVKQLLSELGNRGVVA